MRDNIIKLLFIFLCSCSANSNSLPRTILTIDFQDFFKNDIVGLSIEGCHVFTDRELISNEILGLTDLSIQVFEKTPSLITVAYDGNRKDCRLELEMDSSIVLSVTLNGREKEFIVNTNKGEYIGFEKNTDGVHMLQSRFPFEYD